MIDHNPDSGNAPGLSDYLSEVHAGAGCLAHILKAIALLEVHRVYPGVRETLAYIAEDLGAKLHTALDDEKLPRGQIR